MQTLLNIAQANHSPPLHTEPYNIISKYIPLYKKELSYLTTQMDVFPTSQDN